MIINVAIATDSVLYLPFFVSLYGGNFEKTPNGSIKVNIIARADDPYFSKDAVKNLSSVDGFVTFAVIFGYADIGICDPSLIVYLCQDNQESRSLASAIFKEFLKALSERQRADFKEHHAQFFTRGRINEQSLTNFIKQRAVKNIGGLISRVAFVVIGNGSLTTTEDNGSVSIGQAHFGNPLSNFARRNVKKIFASKSPSTGNCVAKCWQNAHETSSCVGISPVSYGEEINEVIRTIGNDTNESVALSCDFISIDHVEKTSIKVKSEGAEIEGNIRVLEDWILRSDQKVMFTGLITPTTNHGKEAAISGFLYALNKSLYEIKQRACSDRSTDLFVYIKSRLTASTDKAEEDLIRLLVTSSVVEKQIGLDDAIYSYVLRLIKWNSEDRFIYYENVSPSSVDLREMYLIRKRSNDIKAELSDSEESFINSFIDDSFLKAWGSIEEKILRYKKKKAWKLIDSNAFMIIFIVIQVLSLVATLLDYKLQPSGRFLLYFNGWRFFDKQIVGWNAVHFVFVTFGFLLFISIYGAWNLQNLKKYDTFMYKSDSKGKSS